ncbi:restriction system protein [Polaromonas sp. YR568]|uniref:restriction endonuclease n=1 Tax=Polaromonas sp. YR568 TaxID=1855301 RepID=UPI0008E24C88|nr:restriction endonuclease [Polaromonas sp. YR568]SFU30988.1 restriction system protein [Polaromonas sp. YR568]
MGSSDSNGSSSSNKPLIDHTKLSLREWLKIVLTPEEDRKVLTQVCCFPTDELLREFLLNVDLVSDIECRHLLRSLLIGGGTYGFDHRNLPFHIENLPLEKSEYLRRLITGERAWEGIHWILDLLPDNPRKALAVMEIFSSNFFNQLSDGFLNGLNDAASIIKTRYIKRDHEPDVLLELKPLEFEFLAYELFRAMGYEATHTGKSGDGGIDVRAWKKERGQQEHVFIQCKLVKDKVGVSPLRELFAVVETHRASRGVFITNSEFTKPAIRESGLRGHRVELLGFAALDRLLNENFGPEWPARLPALVWRANKRDRS